MAKPYYNAILENSDILKETVSNIVENLLKQLLEKRVINTRQLKELMVLGKDPDLLCDKLLEILGSNLNDRESFNAIIALKESGSEDLANKILETYLKTQASQCKKRHEKSQGELYCSSPLSSVSPNELAEILVQYEGLVKQWVAFADFLQVQQSTLLEIQTMSIYTPAAKRFRILLKEYVEHHGKRVPLAEICNILTSMSLPQNEAADEINRKYPNGYLVANSGH